MYTTGYPSQAPVVTLRPGQEQDILKTKRHDIFLSPNRSFNNYFKDSAAYGRS